MPRRSTCVLNSVVPRSLSYMPVLALSMPLPLFFSSGPRLAPTRLRDFIFLFRRLWRLLPFRAMSSHVLFPLVVVFFCSVFFFRPAFLSGPLTSSSWCHVTSLTSSHLVRWPPTWPVTCLAPKAQTSSHLVRYLSHFVFFRTSLLITCHTRSNIHLPTLYLPYTHSHTYTFTYT